MSPLAKDGSQAWFHSPWDEVGLGATSLLASEVLWMVQCLGGADFCSFERVFPLAVQRRSSSSV